MDGQCHPCIITLPNQQYRIYEVHDQHQSIEQLTNFNVHFALTNEEIRHQDITSIALYKESYILLTPKDAFPKQKRFNWMTYL